MTPTCPRLFEVEAWRDGRLQGAEAEHFQAHLAGCRSCTHEARSLDRLASSLRRPVSQADELHVRRERTRLLAAFDASLVPAPRKTGVRRWLVAAAAALVCASVALIFIRTSSRTAPPTAKLSAPVVEPVQVSADRDARWTRRADADFETIRLESGALSIRVDHTGSPRRLRVLLPDGELEDIGTTFTVSAELGRTTRVSVQEGRVVLRLQGLPPLTLGAGQSWSARPATSAEDSNQPPPPPLRRAKPSASPPTAPTPTGSEVVVPSDPSAEFRGAMAALDRGDNSQAASLFGAFVERYPRESRAEDASYLRVLALQRAGNADATQRAASDYLRRYPRGFRKAEVEPLARPAAP